MFTDILGFLRGSRARSSEGDAAGGLHVLVFSRDRALQLDSLLRSVRDHLLVPHVRVGVIYTASGPRYASGYRKCIARRLLADLQWIEQGSFRSDVLAFADAMQPHDLLMFLVDDNIVFRPFDDRALLQQFSPRHLFISMRCSRQYPEVPPSFMRTEPFLEWRWNGGFRRRQSWHYPFSVDGNIFHARHIQRVMRQTQFSAPNSLEGRMNTNRHRWWVMRIPLAMAPCEAVVVNNPLNRVQTEGATWHQDISPEQLNEAYLSGKVIDNRVLYHAPRTGVHSALGIQLVDEERAV